MLNNITKRLKIHFFGLKYAVNLIFDKVKSFGIRCRHPIEMDLSQFDTSMLLNDTNLDEIRYSTGGPEDPIISRKLDLILKHYSSYRESILGGRHVNLSEGRIRIA